jgi:uncharacterized phage infection (PIP) family protein YhgE
MKFLWRLLGLVSRSDFETQQKEQTQTIEQMIETSEKQMKGFITEQHVSFLRHINQLEMKQNEWLEKLEERLTTLEQTRVQERQQLLEMLKEQEAILEKIGKQLRHDVEGFLTRFVVPEMKKSNDELSIQLKQLQSQLDGAQQEMVVSVNKLEKQYYASTMDQKKSVEHLGQQFKDLQANMQTIQEMVKITWINDVISDMEDTYGLDKGMKK